MSDMEKAWEYFEKIRNALNGLFDILCINFEEDNVFYKCGVENLNGLKETIMDLLKHDYDPSEIKKKLRDIEFNIKKSLFFEKEREKDQG